jgi:hypothetical protein
MVSIPASLMQDTLAVEPITGHGAYGAVYGASFDIAAYVEPGYRTVTNRAGKEVVASAFALCPATPTLNAEDRVTWSGRLYTVIDAQPLRPGGVTHHQEVYLQSVGA